MQRVSYQISVQDIAAHIINVELTFSPDSEFHQLSLPAWIPGSYMIRDFAKHLLNIQASDAGGILPLTQLDKQRWQLPGRNQDITVRYQIYAYDLSVRAAYIDDEVAIINPACVCLAVSGQQHLSQYISLLQPQHLSAQNWRVATGLQRGKDTGFLQFGSYHAENYDKLIDTPVLLGRFTLTEFSIQDVPHYLVITGDNLTDYTKMTEDVQQICQQQAQVFGGLPEDLSEYWFLTWITEDGYGGLEHHNSTLLLCSRFDLLKPGLSAVSQEKYQNFLGLCSHEYFHTWWVKRLKPAVFQQYKLDSEQYTSQLWIYEGFTSYFDDMALVRTGLISTEQYLSTLAKTITRVTRNPSDTVQSLQDSSFNAWTKFYKQDENAPNAVVSYYAKGALLAWCLDAHLRNQGYSLDQLVRHLWQQYRQTGTEDSSIFSALAELGFAALAEQLTHWVSQPVALPLAEAASLLGTALQFRPAESPDDLTGPANNLLPAVWLGAQYKTGTAGVQLTQVYHASPAHQAGIMVGDQLLALAGYKLTLQSLPELLQRLPLGTEQTIHLFRKDRLLTVNLTLTTAPEKVALLSVADAESVRDWLQPYRFTELAAITPDPAVPETS